MTEFAPFSPAQLAGYAALALGVAAFLQKRDSRLKILNGTESLVYAVHFTLLGNPAAATSAFVSGIRSLVAVRFRSAWLAVVFVAITLALGISVVTAAEGWVPILAASSATVAVFLLEGIPLRLVFLACTLCWLANNIYSGSIGGTVLETLIAFANGSTILRMLRDRTRAAVPLRS